MVFKFPFKTDKFTAYADASEAKTAKLSLAVMVRNEINDQLITNGILVSLLKDKAYQPIQNLSGYFCFIDMPPGKYKLIVQSKSLEGGQFFNEEMSLSIPLSNELDPVQEIKLTPKPSYLFSANATLIRGTISRKPISPKNEGEPVVGATVTAGYKGEQKIMNAITNDAGEFVLFIKQIRFENVKKKNNNIKNISIDIVKEKHTISIETKDFLKGKPFLEGETGVIVIKEFPPI